MDKNHLWSLRLGYSSKQANQIEKLGIEAFVKKSIENSFNNKMPSFLDDEPKSLKEFKAIKKNIKELSEDEKKSLLKKQLRNSQELKKWWIDGLIDNEFPLREKMVCFWHNHYVTTLQKIKVNYWMYQQNHCIRENAFGNFKQLTKEMIKTNAMVRYLDNVDNRAGKINENLSRELLELFTIGIGNYTENDIKEGAKALAGLGLGNEKAIYRTIFEDETIKTFFGKQGNLKADDLVDIIFEQKNIPYLITQKILKWFIYDNPSEELVIYYGDYFRTINFEIKPLLIKIFTEEFEKENAGSKIKDPLTYILQLKNELNIEEIPAELLVFFLRQQGMDIFNQPNVKGWEGGNSWLTSQIFLQRNNVADLLCNGRTISRKSLNKMPDEIMKDDFVIDKIKVSIDFDTSGDNKNIINDLSNRLLFKTEQNLQKDMEEILKYDFNPTSENAQNAVMRLFNYIVKTPEFQLI